MHIYLASEILERFFQCDRSFGAPTYLPLFGHDLSIIREPNILPATQIA